MSRCKQLLKLVMIFGVFYPSGAWACHNEPFSLSGHKPQYSKNFITVYLSENSTVITSTSFKCDTWSGFFKKEYHFIAENAAKGKGPHLDTLAHMLGCSPLVYSEFAVTLQKNYQTLFFEKAHPANLFKNKIYQVIKENQQLSQGCVLS
jgi:hypothetical protein